MMLRFTAIFALSLTLSAGYAVAQQASTYPAVDAPTGTTGPSAPKSGASTGSGQRNTTGGNAQTCTDSCNRSYEVCVDQDSALPGHEDTLRNSNNAASNLIGAQSDCADHLRSCLNTCGG